MATKNVMLAALAALILPSVCLQAQTRSLIYNTTNGHVVYSNANPLRFTNEAVFGAATGDVVTISDQGFSFSSTNTNTSSTVFSFEESGADKLRQNARSNLGLGATWLTNTDVTNFRTAIGLGQADNVQIGWDGGSLTTDDFNAGNVNVSTAVTFTTNAAAAATRANLGFSTNLNTLWTATNVTSAQSAIGLDASSEVTFLSITLSEGVDSFPLTAFASDNRNALGLGSTNIVTFAGITNNGNIRINQTATNNGLLYIYRTNSEAFLGLANLIASNNVTVSNETLFRVGVAEATNKAAQFGFRATNTNGTGVAVFSTFGNNALMMIGASDRSITNAAIEADIWTISPTNRVMTLRDTNTGAMTMHRDLGFAATLTNAAPTNTTNVAVWLRVWVGTNSYRLPLYQ